MSSFRDKHHRYSLALTAVLAVTLVVLLVVLGTAAVEDADGRGAPPIGNGQGGVDLVPVGGDDFASPVNVAFAPGESDKVYVVEQDGLVKVVVAGVTQGSAFLDATNVTNESGEQGLLGLAFHPDFATNGLLYVYYTDSGNGDIVISEYDTISATEADEDSRRQVLRIRHRFADNHNGGQVAFGPDGYLYLGTGDGGGGADPRENGQDKRSLLGKLIRIDPLESGADPYTIPAGNPLVGRPGKDEIYARGLRNPFRFTFDSQTGRIAIGDVGENRFEEVDYETQNSLPGANFGWDRWEGFKRHQGPGNESRTPVAKKHTKPIYAYNHSRGCSITGGVVVRDESLLNLYGRYLYGDFCEGELRSLVPKLSKAEGQRKLGTELRGPSSFATDPTSGEVYATSLDGPVYRLEPLP